jgi:hypothetical protein
MKFVGSSLCFIKNRVGWVEVKCKLIVVIGRDVQPSIISFG